MHISKMKMVSVLIIGLFIGTGIIPNAIGKQRLCTYPTIDELDQYNTEYDWFVKLLSYSEEKAQSFTPTKNIITRAFLHLHIHFLSSYHPQDLDTTIYVSIRENLSGDDLASSSVNTQDFIIPSDWWYHDYWIEFDVPDLSVVPGKPYYIVCEAFGYDYLSACWYINGVDRYYGGSAWYCTGNTWQHHAHFDFCFKTYGRTNTQPTVPTISGPTQGRVGSAKTYDVCSIDADYDALYYLFEWGDNSSSEWLGPYEPGETIQQSHVWYDAGNYIVKVKVKDQFDLESGWATIEVSMPKIAIDNLCMQFIHKLLERFLFH